MYHKGLNQLYSYLKVSFFILIIRCVKVHFFPFIVQLQEILRERICHQQLPVKPEGVEAQQKWGHVIILLLYCKDKVEV